MDVKEFKPKHTPLLSNTDPGWLKFLADIQNDDVVVTVAPDPDAYLRRIHLDENTSMQWIATLCRRHSNERGQVVVTFELDDQGKLFGYVRRQPVCDRAAMFHRPQAD